MKCLYKALVWFADWRVNACRKKMRHADNSMWHSECDQEERTYWTQRYREFEKQAGNWGFQAETLRKLIE